MNSPREEIGSFTVQAETGEEKEIIISQEVVSHYNKEHINSGKYLTLETIDGPTVEATDRDHVFRLEDGTVLRRR